MGKINLYGPRVQRLSFQPVYLYGSAVVDRYPLLRSYSKQNDHLHHTFEHGPLQENRGFEQRLPKYTFSDHFPLRNCKEKGIYFLQLQQFYIVYSNVFDVFYHKHRACHMFSILFYIEETGLDCQCFHSGAISVYSLALLIFPLVMSSRLSLLYNRVALGPTCPEHYMMWVSF